METSGILRATECVVLFADIADSSVLYERIGNEAAAKRINGCLKAMQTVVMHSGGQVIKLTGDGLMAVFEKADAALEASSAMGMELGELPAAGEHRIDIRIGFHHGPAVSTGNDLFGETVNVAARFCEVASTGTAVTSSETAALLSKGNQRKLRKIPARPLKGINRHFDLLELICDDYSKVTAVFASIDFSALHPSRLELNFCGESRVLDEGAHRVTIGRDPAADVVLSNTHASRRHCVIEERGGKFVVIDSSSNGTFVVEEGGRSLRLRREELVLDSHGWITFGRPRGPGVDEMEYRFVG
ncbi:MAG: adenylate/guanylate cyclase domain-containing protein [Zoogloeaceae bacterium]|nr:adenylate/guanylate cyclase domain-containing protein [Rhodocyclaceae bacterium]MCP5237612.1 adenylate/guanylate cyclase domain-containing protein [Zoogloeaceae bacterium]